MSEAPSKTAAPGPEIEALSSAFGAFVRVTEELRASYEKLRERADRIDHELARTNERLSSVLKAIPNGVVVCDAQGSISDLNEAAERILGVKKEAAAGKPRLSIRDAEGLPLLLESGNDASAVERRRTLGGGRTLVLGGAVSEIRDARGSVAGSVEVIEDLTELWELRERIHRVDKLAALGEMSAVIAHEIRNPLNGVQGFADLLARRLQSDDGKLAEYATKIVRGVREVDAIIADLLAFAAPERIQQAPVDLEETVRRACESVLQALPPQRAAGVKIRTAFAESGLRVPGDPVKLGQIFRNLIANAVEAVGAQGEIRVEAAREGARAAVSVQDDGPGIPESLRAKIFDPFFTTKTQGTGLGLAIVRKLVDLHGGSIALTSAAGKRGARFEMSFPTI